MLKYYFLMLLVVAMVFLYAFLRDPCNRQVRVDFSSKYPSYEILRSDATEGSPEDVRCHIFYREPDDEQVYEDIWLYLNSDRGWQFSKVIEERKKEEL